uniref:Uncharacterized protein n=1 Tax=Syphacia muris TaxID=451379 RepID=A0A0N5AZX7_9BILA
MDLLRFSTFDDCNVTTGLFGEAVVTGCVEVTGAFEGVRVNIFFGAEAGSDFVANFLAVLVGAFVGDVFDCKVFPPGRRVFDKNGFDAMFRLSVKN